ncbi:0f39ad71-8d26-41ee-8010-306dc583070e [Sclerotinia trifoliorum]|uniref:0f39ad71-8d26-41ee-8010-306dc583070e n=1 Tax=Sclerotinia trifoliorum TaxID=28548 RepID=A0A8H2VNX1_9HELO|nr:0f39ad71-8d26-41ee-8010-306dc583070e [Sclerotinia trifoliorum]
MTSFEFIYYIYVPTAPRSRRAAIQKYSFPAKEQHIVLDRRLFDDTQRSNDSNDSGSELQGTKTTRGFKPKEKKTWEDKITSPRIYDGDSSSIQTVLNPRLYQEVLIEGLQKGSNTQDTLMLGDNKSNSDEQENLSMGGSHCPPVDYSIELFAIKIIHRDIAVGSIKEGENNEQQGRRKQRYLPETEINKDSESDDNIRSAKQRRTRPLPIDNEQTSFRYNGTQGHPWSRPIIGLSSTTSSTMIDSSTSNFGRHSPATSDSGTVFYQTQKVITT